MTASAKPEKTRIPWSRLDQIEKIPYIFPCSRELIAESSSLQTASTDTYFIINNI